jgi:hypothetical protein
VRLREEKRARVGSRNNLKESPGFSKKINKSGPLIIGVKGLELILLVLVLVIILAYIYNIREPPPLV